MLALLLLVTLAAFALFEFFIFFLSRLLSLRLRFGRSGFGFGVEASASMGAAAMLELLPSLPLVIFAETSGEEMGNSNTTRMFYFCQPRRARRAAASGDVQ